MKLPMYLGGLEKSDLLETFCGRFAFIYSGHIAVMESVSFCAVNHGNGKTVLFAVQSLDRSLIAYLLLILSFPGLRHAKRTTEEWRKICEAAVI